MAGAKGSNTGGLLPALVEGAEDSTAAGPRHAQAPVPSPGGSRARPSARRSPLTSIAVGRLTSAGPVSGAGRHRPYRLKSLERSRKTMEREQRGHVNEFL